MELFNLTTEIESFDGLLLFGDLHGDSYKLDQLINIAVDENRYLFSLGDIVDYGPDSVGVIERFYEVMKDNRAGIIRGNHEDKLGRYINQSREGNVRVQLKGGLLATVDQLKTLSPEYLVVVEDKFLEILDNTNYIVHLEDKYYAHAAVHRNFWNDLTPIKKRDRAYFLFGQIDPVKRTRSDGFPNRIYNWVNDVPSDVIVMVGHDVRDSTKPIIDIGKSGGTTIFTDTGNSKGGVLSYFRIDKKGKLQDSTQEGTQF